MNIHIASIILLLLLVLLRVDVSAAPLRGVGVQCVLGLAAVGDGDDGLGQISLGRDDSLRDNAALKQRLFLAFPEH